MFDFPFQDGVGFETNGVKVTFFLQHSVQRRIGEGGIATKEFRDVQVTIPIDYRQEYPPPELRAGVIAASQHRSLQVAILIEQEQRVIAHALEVPVIGRALLTAVGLTDGAVHVENQCFQRLSLMHRVDPATGKIHERREILFCAENVRLKPADLASRALRNNSIAG